MCSVYFNNFESDVSDCSVRFEDNKIIVTYEDEDGRYVEYKGSKKGKGHYLLFSKEVNGKASLHCFEGSKKLEGSWFEDDLKGMWTIELG